MREATHKAFEQLVNQVGRSLARHLRSLMGPWVVAQSDCYSPAASAAVSAFNAAFSSEKQREAIAFCRMEVMAVIWILFVYLLPFLLLTILRVTKFNCTPNR